MNRFFRTMVTVLLLDGVGGSLAMAESAGFDTEKLKNWHQWRGPFANGIADPDAKPPLRWDASTHIRWKTELPGEGASTPIVWGERIFLLSAIKTGRRPEMPTVKDSRALTEPPNLIYEFVVTCVDRANGAIQWQKVAVEQAPHEGHHQTHSYAGGSPATDGERLYVSFGTRGIYCFDFDGQIIWSRDLGKIRTRRGWGEASTVVVHRGNLIVIWDQEDDSYLFNLDSKTGRTQWQVDRDEPSNWSTPLILSKDQTTQIVVNGTNRARGYDIRNGNVIWACGDLSVNAIPSPIAADGLIYCMSGYRKSVLYAIPEDSSGDISDSEKLAWVHARDTSYVASPLVHEGRIYMVKGLSPLMTVLDAKTGETLDGPNRLPGLTTVYSSPILANGRIYLTDREGTTIVLDAGPQPRVMATNRLGDRIDASPVAIGNRLYLRSLRHMYCIE